MFRINRFPFVDPVEDCACDRPLLERTANAAVKRVAPYMVDSEGTKLFFMDSFGLRGQVPGECDACYAAFIDGFKKSQAAGDDD